MSTSRVRARVKTMVNIEVLSVLKSESGSRLSAIVSVPVVERLRAAHCAK